MSSRIFHCFITLLALAVFISSGNQAVNAADDGDKSTWSIEQAPGEKTEQAIDVTEGTWINLDVSPDGTKIVFDLLGDIYSMPIGGADGTDGTYPTKLAEGVAWDMQPRFSPDGNWIAFTSDRAGKNERSGDNLWIMRSDGSEPTQITNESFRLLNGPAWSPDGNYLVARKHFTGRRSLGAGEIWMYHRAAKDANAMEGVQLTQKSSDQKDINEPIFSPDGKYVFYSQDATPGDTFEYDKDSSQQIYIVNRLNLETGKTEAYITGPGGACRPTPSPDGKSVAFIRRKGASTGLHLLDCESGEIRLIYADMERDMQEAWAIHGVYPSFAWMPDGHSIVAWAKGKIRRIDLESGSTEIIPFHITDSRQVTSKVRFPIEVAPDEFSVKLLRWVQTSPKGNQVAFQALGHIYVRELPEGTPRRLTSQTEHFEYYPSYSQDGKYIVYSTWNDKSLGSVRVASAHPDADQESWKVTSQAGHYAEPVFSPDGKTIVFVKSSGGYLTSPLWSRETGLYQIPSHGGGMSRVSDSGEHPQFAADNSRVFFTASGSSNDADNLGLYSIALDGQDKRQHFNSQWGTDFRVSPDGKWIAFIERFNVHVAPFVQAGKSIEIGPNTTSIPIAKVSHKAGDWIHFSGDSKTLAWSLGPTMYTQSLQEAFQFLRDHGSESESVETALPTEIEIGFQAPYAKPTTTVALVGGRIVTMGPEGIIRNGTILVQGNRIVAVGPKADVEIPEGALVIKTPGLAIMPGLIDAHAHGSQASLGMVPQANWINYTNLAFGVTTVHDPSNDTQSVFAASEMAKSGEIVSPRIFSTGTILYGAAGSYKADIENLEDALFHLKRMKAVGAFSVKSYNQPRRDQRQQVVAAARELEMMVVPEGGSTFMHNMTMIVDGHTGIEHTLPVQTAYDDVMDLWRGTQVGYTPTLCVAYGGISGERYWYDVDDLWLHPRLNQFVPPHVLHPRSRRRMKAPLEDYNHIKVAQIAAQVVKDGGLVQIGGHGQLAGMAAHWELWSFVQGGMKPIEALQCGTINGAKYLGLDGDLGSIEPGKLADLIVIERGFDPTKNIRHSEKISMVMANGKLFDATTMAGISEPEIAAPHFYFQDGNQDLGTRMPRIPGCDCCRPGGQLQWWVEKP